MTNRSTHTARWVHFGRQCNNPLEGSLHANTRMWNHANQAHSTHVAHTSRTVGEGSHTASTSNTATIASCATN